MIFGKNSSDKRLEDSLIKTRRHRNIVSNLMNLLIMELHKKAETHDQSKLESPEAEIFAFYPDYIEESNYMSEEYQSLIKHYNEAITHHFQNNSHHPEHFKNGVKDMNIIEIIEMLCNWKANLKDCESLDTKIKKYKKLYGLSNDLTNILLNTSKLFDKTK